MLLVLALPPQAAAVEWLLGLGIALLDRGQPPKGGLQYRLNSAPRDHGGLRGQQRGTLSFLLVFLLVLLKNQLLIPISVEAFKP